MDASQRCKLCQVRPVAVSGELSIRGAFCQDCISRCHDDDHLGHWCAIDRYAEAVE
ncbi:hypothetical protein K1T35_47730 (plasmid) [Pseudonocardia sp. DSM 110487]|uniref:hypothetical protein n=1 Tax=Pseudonocardia sp. DSM 110487 TaxID=2865833 RepID=UPI001C6A84D4|nr:hypothetical protein [Pseudonocardia sp. DSM 110487]QYN41042.1 hypothetical protein K1T35_47730 [Pseudonocardia sp. DSM 110487]